MNTRLQRFLEAENISQAEFAQRIGITRSTVTHLLSGRNKPGYEVLVSIIQHFPTLNLEWLLDGRGKMYKDADFPQTKKENAENQATEEYMEGEIDPSVPSADPEFIWRNSVGYPAPAESNNLHKKSKSPANQRKITRIIAFFDDGSFQELDSPSQ